jgi:hypothetical protein
MRSLRGCIYELCGLFIEGVEYIVIEKNVTLFAQFKTLESVRVLGDFGNVCVRKVHFT